MARSTSDALLFLLAWLTISILIEPQHGVRAASLLETSSFETIMTIRYYRPGQHMDIRLEEKYSHDQQRLLLNVRGSRSKNWWQEGHKKSEFEDSTFFYDAKSDVSLLYQDLGIGGCKHVDSDALMKSLDLNILPDDEFKDGIPNHIVGPSRWIYYIANQRRKLKLSLAESVHVVRNIRSVRYLMKLTDRHGKQVDVRVYYPEASLTQANHDDSVPNLIVFDHEDKMMRFIEVLLVRFHSKSSFESPNPYSNWASMPNLFEPEMDAFMLAPATGCSALLGLSNRKTLFELRHKSNAAANNTELPPPISRRFSFKAHIRHDRVYKGSREFSAYVAYDNVLEAMRVDLSATPYTTPPTTQIFNFYRNRMYHVLDEAHLNGDYRLKHIVSADETNLSQRKAASLSQISTRATGPKCTSAQIHTTSTWVPYSFGHLLWGADTFAYLGQARIRGIRTSVYEALNSKLPYWLEQPVDYCDTRGIYKTRQAFGSLLDPSPREHLVTLVYISDEGDAAADEDRLLLMEIYRMSLDYTVVYDKRTVTFQDFSWYLVPLSPIKSPLAELEATQAPPSEMFRPNAWELFSLADSCAADISADEGNEHVRVEMLLESVNPVDMTKPTSAKLLATNPIDRNLATLGALQKNFHAILTMIYDLQTRPLVNGGKSQQRQQKEAASGESRSRDGAAKHLQMLVAFNVARHSKVTNDLYYVGRGNRILGQSWYFHLPTFAYCFALASHRPAEVYFAYEPDSNSCYIGTKSAQQINKEIGGKGAFELNSEGNMEIYWTRKLNDYHGIVERMAELVDVHSKQRLRMLDRILVLKTGSATATDQSSRIEMSVKRLKVDDDVQKSVSASNGNKKLNSGGAVDFVDKIDGFGLIKREGLVESAQMSGGGDGAQPIELTTFGQCQSICSTDSDCKSFSFCVQGAQVECLISRVSLSSPALAESLMSASKPQSGRYELQVDDDGATTSGATTVQLRKHLNCAIHNKRYTKYFNTAIKLKLISLINKGIVRVTGGAEECARICYKQNVKLMAEERRALASLHGYEDTLASVTRATRDLIDKGCFTFYYVDYLQVPTDMLDKWNQLANLNSHRQEHQTRESGDSRAPAVGGYCALQAFSPEHGNHSESSLHFDSLLDVVRYDFSELEMFEQEYGTHMIGSELSEEEIAAYDKVSHLQKAMQYGRSKSGGDAPELEHLDQKSLDLVKAVLKRGDNIQVPMYGHKELCAGLCLTHMTGLWPACRSFELIKEKTFLGETKFKCVFNTMSKHDAIASGRLDLIDSTTSSSQLERWHYEPRVAALSPTIGESFELALGTEELNQLECNIKHLDHASHVTMIVSVAIVSGLLLGIFMGTYGLQKVLAAARRRRSSQDSMAAALGQDFPMTITH